MLAWTSRCTTGRAQRTSTLYGPHNRERHSVQQNKEIS